MQLTEQNALSKLEEYIANLRGYPGHCEGKGIVVCGGGSRMFTNSWVCINVLRRLGCSLPIQLWHLGDEELSDRMRALITGLSVQCVDALKLRDTRPCRTLHGWELKAYALVNSPFEEVLLLDADNVAVTNPEFLFDTSEYKRTGAVFWPDYNRLAETRKIWRLCGIEYRDEPEFESGQILVNKARVWKSLLVSLWLNEHSDFFYNFVHGDKETFHMAFRKLDTPYCMPSRGIHSLDGTMCQHDFVGRRVFQHRNMDKWSFFDANCRVAGFLLEDECFEYLAELRRLWCGTVVFSDEKDIVPYQSNPAVQLTAQPFEYIRIGYDVREINFFIDGRIGAGADECERFWRILKEGEKTVLEIASESKVTCRLHRCSHTFWKGKWCIGEKMPVELRAVLASSQPMRKRSEANLSAVAGETL